jgi:hypothetical protein
MVFPRQKGFTYENIKKCSHKHLTKTKNSLQREEEAGTHRQHGRKSGVPYVLARKRFFFFTKYVCKKKKASSGKEVFLTSLPEGASLRTFPGKGPT